MENTDIAGVFYRIADMLELKEENMFRIRAYRTAAHNIAGLPRRLEDLYKEDPSVLDNIPGIGKDLKEKIIEMLESGELAYYVDLKREFPEGYLDLLNLSGLGPKKAKKLRIELGIESIEDLEKACKDGKVEGLDGMGEKTRDKILESIGHFREQQGRMLLPEADRIADQVMAYLAGSKAFKKIEKAGSLRRGKDTVGDLDIIAIADDPEKAMDHFVCYPGAEHVLAKGGTKASISMKHGPQVDLRIVDASCFGAALIYFTGSKQHNIELRTIAKAGHCKLSEYGVFKVGKDGREKFTAGGTEDEVYEALGMEWIPPELREAIGEIDLAIDRRLPKDLLALADIKGDLHMHSTETDGSNTVEELIEACKGKGYKYIAITDHSKYVRVANGMDEERLGKYCERIRKISAKIKGIKVLVGAEVDILKDGELDFSDSALKDLDIVIAAIHSDFALEKEKQTERILRAMDNKYVNVLAHPSGRIITTRKGLDFDFERVFEKARDNMVALEVNTHGERIDLNGANCLRAREKGAKLAIDTDAHSLSHLELLKYGVMTARRGGAVKGDVINTYTIDKLTRFLNKKNG